MKTYAYACYWRLATAKPALLRADEGRNIGLLIGGMTDNPPLLLKEVKAAYSRHIPEGLNTPAIQSLKMAAMALE